MDDEWEGMVKRWGMARKGGPPVLVPSMPWPFGSWRMREGKNSIALMEMKGLEGADSLGWPIDQPCTGTSLP